MAEKILKVTRETLVPIGMVITLFGAVWYMATLNTRVGYNSERVETVEVGLGQVPTLREFDTFKQDIGKRFDTLEQLLTK